MRQADQRLQVVKALLTAQLIGALLAGVIGGIWGFSGAFGALAGGMIAFLPNGYFAYRAFRFSGARAARKIVNSFYAGITGKIFITASLFVIVFINLRPLNAPAVFLGFIGVQSLSWFVPLLAVRK